MRLLGSACAALLLTSSCLDDVRNILGGADADADVQTGSDAGADAEPDGAGDLAGDTPEDAAADVASDPVADPDATPDAADAADAAGDLVDAGDALADAEVPVDEVTGSGTWADPYVVRSFPIVHEGDTSDSDERVADSYVCAAATDESGPEVVYRLEIGATGIVTAAVDDVSGDGVDVDVHFLAEDDPDTCTVRHNTTIHQVFSAGDEPYLVVDTWVNGSDVELPGPYELSLDVQPVPDGDCELEVGAIEMINRDEPLMLPIVGEVVREAHLVTTAEFSPGVWPTSFTDGIENHYTITEAASGYEMERSEPWAPAGEGGSEFGQGSGGRPPPLEETWYVNMYWADRPAAGTRMLVFNPANGRGVVTAGGYETGPGSAERIGGATEEIHDHLGSSHRSLLLMGFLVDQELDLGPINCD